MTSPVSPYLHVIYCDDIRQEIGNKLTLVGIYNGTLNADTAPAVMPKLCLHCMLHVPGGLDVTQLTFRVLRDEEVVAEFEASVSSPESSSDKGIVQGQYVAGFTFAPFPIEGPSLLRVEADTNLGMYFAPSLRILVAQSSVDDSGSDESADSIESS